MDDHGPSPSDTSDQKAADEETSDKKTFDGEAGTDLRQTGRVKSTDSGEPELQRPLRSELFVKDLLFSILRVPFLLMFIWLVLIIFGVFPMIIAPLAKLIPETTTQMTILYTVQCLAAIGAGLFLGYHYRHWNVFVACGLLVFVLNSPVWFLDAIGVAIGYQVAPMVFLHRYQK